MTDADPGARPAPDPAVTRGVLPYLGLGGRAARAAEFYARAFAAREIDRVPAEQPGRLMHCALEINGGGLMLTDMRAPWDGEAAPPRGFHLQLVVDEPARWWERALAAGCTVRLPLERQFWGDLFGILEDPFGLRWGINGPADAARDDPAAPSF